MPDHDCPDPSEVDQRVTEDVKRYGWHVTYVREESGLPGWTFSIGLFETFKHPEVLIFGLSMDVSTAVINRLGKSIESGKVYEAGFYYPEVFESIECVFHSVEPIWFPVFLGTATRFYKECEFPVLQCIWPDKDQRFPWSRQFRANLHNAQPWLFRKYLTDARVERFLYASEDTQEFLIALKDIELTWKSVSDSVTSGCAHHKSSSKIWPFENPKSIRTYRLGNHRRSPVPVVGMIHDDDGSWLLIARGDPEDDEPHEVCLGCMLEMDSSISDVADLPRGWMARRKESGVVWQRRPIPAEEK
jgi:hypothetical protein